MKLIPFLVCILVLLLSGVSVAQDASPSPAQKQIRVRVSGRVAKTSIYFLPANATLSDAITAAGDLQDDAKTVSIRRQLHTVAQFQAKDVCNGAQNTALRDGDLIKVEGKPMKPEL